MWAHLLSIHLIIIMIIIIIKVQTCAMAFKTSKEVPNRLAMIPIHDFVFQKNICYTFQPKIGGKKKISLFFAPNAIVLSTSDHDIYIYIRHVSKHVKIGNM